MEIILDILLELIVEGSQTIGVNKKYSKWIRYPLLCLAGVLYCGVIALFVVCGVLVLGDGLWRAMVVWTFTLAFVVGSIHFFREEYKRYMNKKSKSQ